MAVKEITDRLPEHTFDLLTVNLDGKQQIVQQMGNVTVYRVGNSRRGKYAFPFFALRKAIELHRTNGYDIVWAIMANQAGVAALWFKKKFPQTKFLLTLQEGDSLKKIWSRTWFMRPIYKKIYRRANEIQAISNYLATRARKFGFQKLVHVIPNGVDLTYFGTTTEEKKRELRATLALATEDAVVITTSRLVYKNGIDTLIVAMKEVSAKLLIIGSGKLETKLKLLTQELQLRDKVLFLGHVPHTELGGYLAISDVFVRPSRSEGLGSSFLEAMAIGIPVIGTRVGGIPDFLSDGKTGLFCEVNNPKDLADNITKILSNQELHHTLVQNGKTLVQERYMWDHISVQMKQLFTKS